MPTDALDILCNDFRKALVALEASLSVPVDFSDNEIRAEIIKDAQAKLFLRCASIFYRFCELIQIPGEPETHDPKQEAWRILAKRAYALKIVKDSDYVKVSDILLYADILVECRGYVKSGPYEILLMHLHLDLHKLAFVLKKLIVSIQSSEFTPVSTADCAHQHCQEQS